MIRLSNQAIRYAIGMCILVAAPGLVGCGDDDSGNNAAGKRGSMVLLMHDAPVDDMKEVWVTVESVTMIGADDDTAEVGTSVLAEPVRMDLLALDSTARIIAAAEVEAGAYSKIRLQITDPEFVRDDDSVFTDDAIQLVANGHVDLNTQGDVFIVGDAVTIVSLDVDLENSVQINQTGNGRYILRPQIFVDNDLSDEEGIVIEGAVITSVDLNAGVLTVSTGETESSIDVTVMTNGQTHIINAAQLPLSLSALLLGSTVDIVGTINVESGVVTASRIEVAAL